jgi:hypothetical protein
MVITQKKRIDQYAKIVEWLFVKNYTKGAGEIPFDGEEFKTVAGKLGFDLPDDLGNVLHAPRYRNELLRSIAKRAPAGRQWVIQQVGKGKYAFLARKPSAITANGWMVEEKIADATPGIIAKYAMSDQQILLAKLRYNRLVDIFTGLTCYSLQSHFRTTLEGMGQVETDELYVGFNRRGVHYAIPAQAKGGTERLNVVQIEQDIAVCAEKFHDLVCKPIAAQFMADDLIALFAFEEGEKGIGIYAEKHYRLVPPDSVTIDDLKKYREQTEV